MLNVIYKEERQVVFSVICIFAREAVLAVDVNMHFYGFLIEKQPKI